MLIDAEDSMRLNMMMRRAIVNVMLFVLLWTCTLLHDFAEPDDPVAPNAGAIGASIAGADVSTPINSQPFQGHQHDALIGSKFNSAGTPLQAALLVPLAGANAWAGNLRALAWSSSGRGPPCELSSAQPKLYLLHRALLI